MISCRNPRWPVLFALLPMLAVGVLQPVSAETDDASADGIPTDARIERLREAIERERRALEHERETRRSIEQELGRTREQLERTREELEQLQRSVDPDAGTGD